MNTEHTPGPWCWDDKDALPWTDYDKTDHVPYLINANGRIVMSGDDIRIRNEADGHLMIAAPDLLAALNDMLSILDDAGTEDEETWQPGQRWIFTEDKISAKNRITSARAAIAKAEGKA